MRPYDRWDEGKADAKDFDLDLSAVIFNGKGNYVVRVPGSELYLSDPTPSHLQVMPNVTLPLTFSSLLKLSKFILSLAFLTITASLPLRKLCTSGSWNRATKAAFTLATATRTSPMATSGGNSSCRFSD